MPVRNLFRHRHIEWLMIFGLKLDPNATISVTEILIIVTTLNLDKFGSSRSQTSLAGVFRTTWKERRLWSTCFFLSCIYLVLISYSKTLITDHVRSCCKPLPFQTMVSFLLPPQPTFVGPRSVRKEAAKRHMVSKEFIDSSQHPGHEGAIQLVEPHVAFPFSVPLSSNLVPGSLLSPEFLQL